MIQISRWTYPFTVDVLPAMWVDLNELQEDGVHGGGIQTRGTDLHHGEHAPVCDNGDRN